MFTYLWAMVRSESATAYITIRLQHLQLRYFPLLMYCVATYSKLPASLSIRFILNSALALFQKTWEPEVRSRFLTFDTPVDDAGRGTRARAPRAAPESML